MSSGTVWDVPFLPMVHWDEMDSGIQGGTAPLCPFLPMVHWDGMDSGTKA